MLIVLKRLFLLKTEGGATVKKYMMYLFITGNGLAEEASWISCWGEWEITWSSKPKPEDSVSCETEERLC